MEGNGQKKDGTDNAHIRPVSSLLSHFENLSHRRAPSAATNGTRDTPSFLRTLEPGDDVRSSSRASLDLSRSHTPWDSTPELNRSHGSLHGNGIPPRPGRTPGVSPGRRQDRPMSLSLRSSPQLPPTLTVDSPRSPPRGFGALGEHEDHVQLPRSPLNASRESLPTIPQGGRPTTPVTSRFPIEPEVGSLSPGPTGSMTSGRESPQDHHGKSASLPPPVNRVDKPKIPVKPAALSHHDGGGGSLTTPQPERAPADDRISPFSTPPSSPEKDSPKRNPPTSSGIQLARSPSRRSPSQPPAEPPRYRFEERTSTPQPPLFREPSFTQRHSVPEPPRETRPLSVQIPPRPSLPAEPLSAVPLSANRIPMHDGFSERPGLPPRQPSIARRGGPSPSRLSIQREISVHSIPPPTPQRESRYLDSPAFPMPPPTPNRESRQLRRDELPTPTTVQRHPSIARENRPGPPPAVPERPVAERPIADRPVVERQSVRVHSEDEQNLDSVPVARNDYPDASTANRRPPLLKSGPMEINTRYDTRLMDVCGKHVCTTGYITRVWDLTTGEQLMSLSHGETVKSLSLAFKPGVGLEDEGQRVWLGTNSGELHEVDIATGSIVASRSYPSRKEVVKILRHKKEMWTLDDEGRLLVWPPDENGTPNLQYSYHNPYDRVARGHTFSMVVGDKLWLAAGKEVHVYRPNARDDISFKVLSRPLGAHHTGDVTSGAYTTRDGGLVYLGHSDGKVTVYSAKDYACLAVVNVSVYKINCLGIVGDYLWAAYKTGMIYVYDTSTNPWTVKKDWRAHDSPVSGFLLDSSSVWTMNRLQVTSLGDDNCIRLWDGMLEDDWLETRMQTRDVEFCNFREIHAAVITWNAGASTPGSVRTSSFIQDAIHPENPPEIIVFGFQELVDLENKKITAKSLLLGSKKKDSGDKEHMSRQYRVWMEHLTRCINDCMPLEESYVLLHSANMIGLFTCVFVKHKERQRITDISASEIKRGMGGLHGNKGALLFRFTLDDSSICLVNCHLAAGQTQTAHRNNDIAAILEAESLPAEPSLAVRANRYVGGGDGSMIMDHEICILNGDLNYRIDAIPRNVIIDAVRSNNLTKLLERDQLLASRRKNPGFRLRSFNESPITFAPTYKYDVGTDEYDSSDKKRAPAWCDRVLYRGLGRVRQLEYRRHEVRASDHRPVSAAFKFRIKSVLPAEREAVWEACQQEFSREKRRLASEASIEYLITVLGTEPQQARSLIMGNGN